MNFSSSKDYNSIKYLLHNRLSESGWCDQVRMLIRLKLREHEHLSLDDLIDFALPKARSLVPATIKREMLQKLKDIDVEIENRMDSKMDRSTTEKR